MAGRRLWIVGVLLMVFHPVVSGCAARVTARTARWYEEGRARAVGAPGSPRPEELAQDARRLPLPQRQIVEAALALAGAPSDGLDCSGLVVRVYEAAGIEVPRTVRRLLTAGRPVPGSEFRPGDLVFFAFGGRGADHVGIYAGGGAFVHVSRSARSVRLESLAEVAFAGRQVAARRLLAEPLP